MSNIKTNIVSTIVDAIDKIYPLEQQTISKIKAWSPHLSTVLELVKFKTIYALNQFSYNAWQKAASSLYYVATFKHAANTKSYADPLSVTEAALFTSISHLVIDGAIGMCYTTTAAASLASYGRLVGSNHFKVAGLALEAYHVLYQDNQISESICNECGIIENKIESYLNMNGTLAHNFTIEGL
jgi:hypothetical protein